MRRSLRLLLPIALVAMVTACAAPAPAQAFDPTKPICTLAGLVSTLAGKICSTARHAGSVLKAGQKLLGGHIGSAVKSLTSSGAAVHALTATAAFVAAGAWVIGGARIVLHETAAVISATTRPQLQSTWFSASYWRMAGISALLTLPFLFAAAVQSLLRSDISLLARSAFGYLPLGLLGVSIAAPLTQLLLAASDELSSLVSTASGYTQAGFVHTGALTISLSGVSASAFPVFFIGLLAVAATMILWIELLIRAAAVYVIVLMLPLFFAALVWPARRVWATRAVELLVALILSKFAIVAVLALGSAALGHTVLPNLTQMLAGTTLVLLAAFSPWALLRLLPLHELAASVEGLRGGPLRSMSMADADAQGLARGNADRAPHEDGLGPVDASVGEPGAARAAVQGLDGQSEVGGVPSNVGGGRPDAGAGQIALGGGQPDVGGGQPNVGGGPPDVGGGRSDVAAGGPGPGGVRGAPVPADGDAAPPAAPPPHDVTQSDRRPWAEGMEPPFVGTDEDWGTLELGPGGLAGEDDGE